MKENDCCTFCKKYRLYILYYCILTVLFNVLMFSYSVILSYNFQAGTVELILLNKSLLIYANKLSELKNNSLID